MQFETTGNLLTEGSRSVQSDQNPGQYLSRAVQSLEDKPGFFTKLLLILRPIWLKNPVSCPWGLML
ncbi:hypothetical protein NG796_18795 [Laspinema sp. A4]|uniref:hypothetical protein n=1 Tax=Laspinema sp. D2d TaxID=2953686 RepID=UPI0021BA4AC7|nr:hypothetical protein [Laspinema sp. D2d]MCT7985325.1 hypothetical protein [Laspinema sp. D2d]